MRKISYYFIPDLSLNLGRDSIQNAGREYDDIMAYA